MGMLVRQGLSVQQLKEYARDRAAATLKRLRAEVIAIERTFPELALSKSRTVVRASVKRARKPGRAMSAAGRKAVSARMKAYWAERRKAQVKVK